MHLTLLQQKRRSIQIKQKANLFVNNHIIITDTTGNNLNKTNDIKIRDQKIMDKYVKNGTFYAIFLML